MRKGQMDEFGWILLGALVFIITVTAFWTASSKEPIPVVSPKSVELRVARDSSASFLLSVNGSSAGKMTNVTFTPTGDIRSWMSFDRNNFDTEGLVNVKVTVAVPRDITVKTYTGDIKVSSKGGEVSIPVTINVISSVTEVKVKSRPIELGDINIRYFIGPEDMASKENFEVSKSLFGGSEEKISIQVPPEKLSLMKSGYINLSIQSTNKEGNIVIIFNGKEVWNRQVTDSVKIPIEKSLINDSNTIIVQATPPPFYKFWSTTIYDIKELSFGGNYEDVSERERVFDLSDEEATNFKYFRLTGRVASSSELLSELAIEINGQLVYSKVPPLALLNETLGKTILGDTIYVKSKNNTISFSFERESTYKLNGAFLIVYY